MLILVRYSLRGLIKKKDIAYVVLLKKDIALSATYASTSLIVKKITKHVSLIILHYYISIIINLSLHNYLLFLQTCDNYLIYEILYY